MNVKTPVEILDTALSVGVRKVEMTRSSVFRLSVLSVLAGAYISLGGILSVIIGFGFPEITAGNPAMQKLLSGCMFPIGLILVVMLGAELFTGNNALLIPAFMQRRYSLWTVLKNWLIVYSGNFVGALAFTYFMVYAVGLTAGEPYHTAVQNIAVAKVGMSWCTVFLKAIGANWCVCLAVWLALAGHNMLEKMAGCWLPVMAFVALGYEHCIANMFFIPIGMMEGAPVEMWDAVVNNMIPSTLGNIAGGALLVGCVHAMVHGRPRS